MKILKSSFNKLNYHRWELGLVPAVPDSGRGYNVNYSLANGKLFSRIMVQATTTTDALEQACYFVAAIYGCRPESIDLHAVYDELDNLLWVDEPYYKIIQGKYEFRGIDRRSFLKYFGATNAAILFGLIPSRLFAGSTSTPLSGTASGFTVVGQQVFTSSSSWTVPAGVTSACAVLVGAGGTGDDGNSGDGGGGGGGGGALAYANNIPVTAGASYSVVVGLGNSSGNGYGSRAANGGSSSVTIGSYSITANGGQGGASYSNSPGSTGGTFSHANTPGGVTTGGGLGGDGGAGYNGGGGGGGAGGYDGRGGHGSTSLSGYALYTSGFDGVGTGSGGGGGASYSPGAGMLGGGSGGSGQNDLTGGGGGGSNIYASSTTSGTAGNGSTSSGSKGGNGGFPGGGGGGSYDNGTGVAATGGNGVVRIIWGPSRSFPSNAT